MCQDMQCSTGSIKYVAAHVSAGVAHHREMQMLNHLPGPANVVHAPWGVEILPSCMLNTQLLVVQNSLFAQTFPGPSMPSKTGLIVG
jgi:hypothetical protein